MVFSANNSLSNAELFNATVNLTDTTLTTLIAGTTDRYTYITSLTITSHQGSSGINHIELFDESTSVHQFCFDKNGGGIKLHCNFDCPIKSSAMGNDFKVQANDDPTDFVANILATGFKAGN